MNICFVSGDINKTGGTERVCLLIANELSKKHNITILSLKNGMNPSFEYNNHIVFKSLHLEQDTSFFKRKISPYLKMKSFLKENKQDILINVDVISCLYTIPMKKYFNIKIVAWEHFNYRINNGTRNRAFARKLCAKYADYIIVLTKADLIEYKKKLKVNPPIKNIYNPIVGNIKNNQLNSKVVLASGRFTYQKNFEELIYIWEKVEKENLDWKLVICGTGEDYSKIQNIVSNKGLKNVILPGFCNDMEYYYNNADIFVMTSRFEGFPMVLLEAQQHSIPLVAYDCFTGPSEIIEDSKNGFLIEYGNRDEFAQKLIILMNNKKQLQEFSNNSSILIRKYRINKIILEWEEVLNSLNN